MASSTKTPGTFSSDSGSGGLTAWSNPSNAGASDNSYATANVGGSGGTYYLKGVSCGFAISTGATITGIEVSVEVKNAEGTPNNDLFVRLVKGGTVQTAESKTTGVVGSTDAVQTVGGDGQLWSNTWAPSDINNAGFGCTIHQGFNNAANWSVDHVQITVYYTEPSVPFRRSLLGVGY